MALTIESIRYGEFGGYLAYPARAARPLPAIIVIQEAWGLDDHIEEVTRRFAVGGYAAFGVDVYARDGQRPAPLTRDRTAELRSFFDGLAPGQMADATQRDAAASALPEPLRGRVRESTHTMFGQIGKAQDNLVPVMAAASYLRNECDVTRGQKVGAIGFCMGGGLAALLACSDPELAGAISCYGMAPSDEKIAAMRCPLLCLYGALDARVNAGIPELVQSAKKHGKSFEHHVYEGAGHAYFNDERPSYNVAAARDTFVRAVSFFQRNLV